MPQQFLHMAQRRPVLQQMRRKAVPHRVGRNLGVDARFFRVGFQHIPHPLPGEALAAVVDIQGGLALFRPQQLHARAADVPPQVEHRLRVHIDQPLLGALAPGADVALLKVNVLHIEVDHLGNPHPGGVQHFQHTGVAAALRRAGVGHGLQQPPDFLLRDELGHRAAHPGRAQVFGGVVADDAVAGEIAEKRPHGGHFARQRRLPIAQVVPQLADVRVEQVEIHPAPALRVVAGAQVILDELAELAEVVAVRVQRVLREPALHHQMLQKRIYGTIHDDHPTALPCRCLADSAPL